MDMDKDAVRVEFIEDGKVKVSIHKDLVDLLVNNKFMISKGDPDYYVADFAPGVGPTLPPTVDPCDPKPGTTVRLPMPSAAGAPPEEDLADTDRGDD